VKRLIIDLDDTLSSTTGGDYRNAKCNVLVRERLREYRARGFDIVIHSARNMRTYEGQVGKINVHTLPIIIGWLNAFEIPYDEIIVGKPWCGFEGFYVDDKAVRPDEFVSKTFDELSAMLAESARRLHDMER
jgi:capsule biosynthesis phosphatase